mgnify:CR=1 FL=1
MAARQAWVFPTPVGVFPPTGHLLTDAAGLPHARGGVSYGTIGGGAGGGSSPRPWGCFCVTNSKMPTGSVFPTPVGVFPPGVGHRTLAKGLPHARGGVSPLDYVVRRFASLPHARGGVSDCFILLCPFGVSSPRPWGCFCIIWQNLARAYCLPHARGGVSYDYDKVKNLSESSPRPWGCFPSAVQKLIGGAVFPTPVGVFLADANPTTPPMSLPHARGGVSQCKVVAVLLVESSPRPWGCFFQRRFTGSHP